MGLFDSLRSRLFWLTTPAPQPAVDAPGPPDTDAPTDVTADQTAAPGADAVASGIDGEPKDTATGGEPADAATAAPPEDSGTTEIDLSARQERAANRLLEDERLRGDLTDDEFQPLLDWAMAAAERLVDSTAGDPDDVADQRIEAGLSVVRERVAAVGDAVTAYAEGDHDRLTAALRDAGVPLRDAGAEGSISRLFVQRDLAGPDVAAQIVSQFASAEDDTGASGAEGAS